MDDQNTQALSQVIDRVNIINEMFSEKKTAELEYIDIDCLTKYQAKQIFEYLDAQISPENLYADGERHHDEAMALYRLYLHAGLGLIERGFQVESDDVRTMTIRDELNGFIKSRSSENESSLSMSM